MGTPKLPLSMKDVVLEKDFARSEATWQTVSPTTTCLSTHSNRGSTK